MNRNTVEAQSYHPTTDEFVETVAALRPRVAAFDCDGTLWSGDAGERFFDWELRQDDMIAELRDQGVTAGVLRQHYASYKRGEVDESTMCGEMVTMHRGIAESKLMAAAIGFFDQFFVGLIFPEMRELVRRLTEESLAKFGWSLLRMSG